MNDGLTNRVPLDDGTVAYDDGTGDLRVKFGWDALRSLGKRLCAIINNSRALIIRYFGDNPLVVALVEVIDVLCPLVEDLGSTYGNGSSQLTETISKQEVSASLRAIADKLDGSV